MYIEYNIKIKTWKELIFINRTEIMNLFYLVIIFNLFNLLI